MWWENREVLITGGIRVGKTTRAAYRVLLKMLDPTARLIWIVGPDYLHAQEEFRMVLDWAQRLGLVEAGNWSIPQDGSRKLTTIFGCSVETRSAQHTERLASVAPDLIVLSEPGQMSSEVYEICVGRLIEKRGSLWMIGTLEDGQATPRWQWFEDLASDWLHNPPDSRERSAILPTWTNKAIFPLGLDDPELQAARSKTSEYLWNRMYGGIPEGVNNPVFPLLLEHGGQSLLTQPDHQTYFTDGAIGVDYGRTFEHPSAAVVVAVDNYERFWVREAWKGIRAGPDEIESVVKAMMHNHNIFRGCVDPNQGYMGDRLGFTIATGGTGGGGRPSEMRFSLANELIESQRFFFDIMGPNVREVYSSMRRLGRNVNAKGQLIYDRPLEDDLAQATMYAVEELRGSPGLPIPLDVGTVNFRSQIVPGSSGRI